MLSNTVFGTYREYGTDGRLQDESLDGDIFAALGACHVGGETWAWSGARTQGRVVKGTGESFGTSDSGTYFIRVVRYSGWSCDEDYALVINGLD